VTALIRYVVGNKQNVLIAKLDASISTPVDLSVEPLRRDDLKMLALVELVPVSVPIPIPEHNADVGLTLLPHPNQFVFDHEPQ